MKQAPIIIFVIMAVVAVVAFFKYRDSITKAIDSFKTPKTTTPKSPNSTDLVFPAHGDPIDNRASPSQDGNSIDYFGNLIKSLFQSQEKTPDKILINNESDALKDIRKQVDEIKQKEIQQQQQQTTELNNVAGKTDVLLQSAKQQVTAQKEAIEQAKQAGITLTQQEEEDVKRLNERREASKGTAKFTTKLSGQDLVIAKQIEAEKAKKIFDSSKVQNPFSTASVAKALGKDPKAVTARDIFEIERKAGRRK